MKSFDLVIPAYNESKNLPLLLEKTIAAAQEFGFKSSNFKLILVNNGSIDDSETVIHFLISKNQWQEWIRVVKIERNQGYGHGVFSGLLQTTGEIIGWTHADLQCDPKNAFLAYNLHGASHDVLVKGVRSGRRCADKTVSFVFRILSYLILGLKTNEINAQPKVFSRKLLNYITEPPKGFTFDLYVLYVAQKQKFKILQLPVLFPARIHGLSNWSAHFVGRYKTIFGAIIYMFQLLRAQGRA